MKSICFLIRERKLSENGIKIDTMNTQHGIFFGSPFLLVRWIIARYFRNEFRDRSLASVSFNQAECFKLWIVKVQKLKYSRALLLSVAFQIYTGEISQRLTVLWVCVCEMYSEAMTPGATGGKNYEWQSPFYDMKRRASSQNIKWNQNQLH